MKNIWDTARRPLLIQAPMEDVTDTVFRQIITKAGKPSLSMTEFTSTDALNSPGVQKAMERFQFSDVERPIIAQIWGNKPENYKKTTKLIRSLGFDGIDINMGCPVVKGSCAALINNPKLAREIIEATKSEAGDLPISVKTRIGYNTIVTEEWVKTLLETDIDALILHGRTKKEMSKVPAHWDEIAKAVRLRDAMQKKTLVIGNGDVQSYEEALEKITTYGVDGVMIGRGIFHNLWFFTGRRPEDISLSERLAMLEKHLLLFEQTWGDKKPFNPMKKFYKIYISGFDDAQKMRMELMEKKNAKEAIAHVKTLRTQLKNNSDST